MTPPLLGTYCSLTILALLREVLTDVHVNDIGKRPKTDIEQWVDFYPMGDVRSRSRKDQYHGRQLFQFSCNSKIEEGRVDHDTHAPQRLADRVAAIFEQKNIEVKTIGIAPEPMIAILNFHEARLRYLPRRNITFEGEGNFSVEQGSAHAVVVTIQATLIAA